MGPPILQMPLRSAPPRSSRQLSAYEEDDNVDLKVPPLQAASYNAPFSITALVETVTKKRRLTRAAQNVADTMEDLEIVGGSCSSPVRREWNYHFPDLPPAEEIIRHWTVHKEGASASELRP